MLPYVSKGTLQICLRLRTLREEISLSYLGSLNFITVSLKVEEKVKKKKKRVREMRRTRLTITSFEDKRRGL